MVTPNISANLGPLPVGHTLEDLFPDPEYRSHVFWIKDKGHIIGVRKVALKKDGDIFRSTVTELKAYRRLLKKDSWKDYIMPFRNGQLLDHGQTVYIDFDYVEGMDLIDYSKNGGDKRRVLADIAKALAFCFDAGLTHGDIKGDNIYITKGGKALLFDFGEATIDPRQIDQEDDLYAYMTLCKELTGVVPPVDTDLYKRDIQDVYNDIIAFWKGHRGGRRTMKRHVKLPAKTRSRGKHNQ